MFVVIIYWKQLKKGEKLQQMDIHNIIPVSFIGMV
jgi:hypothetical protein